MVPSVSEMHWNFCFVRDGNIFANPETQGSFVTGKQVADVKQSKEGACG